MISIIFMLVARDKLCISCKLLYILYIVLYYIIMYIIYILYKMWPSFHVVGILKEEAVTDFQTLSKESSVRHHLAKNIVSSLDVTSQKQLGIVSSNRSLQSQKKFLPKNDTKGGKSMRTVDVLIIIVNYEI